MNPSRIVRSCVFRYGFVLVTLVAIACSGPPEAEKPATYSAGSAPSTDPSLALSDLVGNWENVDSGTDHLTRVEILRQDSTAQVLVRMWGSYQPEDCFWG